MTTAKDMCDQLITRVKNLIEFTVITEVPENFRFNGTVPFNMQIANDEIYATVFAETFDEAACRLNLWLETCK